MFPLNGSLKMVAIGLGRVVVLLGCSFLAEVIDKEGRSAPM